MNGKDGRAAGRRARWRRQIAAWKRSGLSQAEYCRRHALGEQQFSWWKRQVNSQWPGRKLSKSNKTLGRAAFVPVQLSDAEAGGWGFEIEGAGGVRLRFRKRPGFSRLRELVALLSGEARWC